MWWFDDALSMTGTLMASSSSISSSTEGTKICDLVKIFLVGVLIVVLIGALIAGGPILMVNLISVAVSNRTTPLKNNTTTE